jgi:hypothetical protein
LYSFKKKFLKETFLKNVINLRPAVCLVVSGPGFVHALSGMANANENAW